MESTRGATQPIPAWYRTLTADQLSATQSLHEALAQDLKDNTTINVYRCLKSLGILPVVRGTNLGKVIRMSRGNNVAFLYFLMTAHYRKPTEMSSSVYSVNEQILMSAIAKLDLPLTLRSLDAVLSPGIAAPTNSSNVQVSKDPPWHAKPLYYVATFKDEVPLDQPIANMENRWFGEYTLNSKSLQRFNIVRDQLEELLDSIYKASEEASASALQVICQHHQTERDLMLEARLLRERKQWQNIQHLMTSNRHREMARNCVNKKLHQDIHRRKRELDLDSSSDDENDGHLENSLPICQKSCHLMAPKEFTLQPVMLIADGEWTDQCEGYHKDKPRLRAGRSTIIQKPLCREGKTSTKLLEELNIFGPTDLPNEVPTNYFHLATKHTPFHFDYFQIFQDPIREPTTEEIIKNTRQRLLEDLSSSTANELEVLENEVEDDCLENALPTVDLSIDEAVTQSVNNMWQQSQLKLSEKPYIDPRISVSNSAQQSQFDPENENQMQVLLTKGLIELKKDTKHVLASFPDCHRLPLLLEWVKRRYGKRYYPYSTHKHMKTVFENYNQVFDQLFRRKQPDHKSKHIFKSRIPGVVYKPVFDL